MDVCLCTHGEARHFGTISCTVHFRLIWCRIIEVKSRFAKLSQKLYRHILMRQVYDVLRRNLLFFYWEGVEAVECRPNGRPDVLPVLGHPDLCQATAARWSCQRCGASLGRRQQPIVVISVARLLLYHAAASLPGRAGVWSSSRS